MGMQSKFNKENHIYKITKNIDLSNMVLTIPSNCTLDFQGGKIVNGNIVLNQTKIMPNGCIITDYISSTMTGTYAKGQCLYDETLGKPKWWTGTKWVDATGAEV